MALPNEPITRGEMYLSNIAGQGTALPSEPITREEMYLDAIAKNGGGGGGTGDGDMKKSVYDSDLAVLSAGGIKAYVSGAIADKVDKVYGKGLSTNDYDDSAKAIVDGVTTALDGKISKSETAGIVKNDGTIDTTISGAVSSNTSAISGIKDGTSIDSFSDVETALSGKENTISDLSTIRSGASAGATAYQKPNDGIPKTDLASAVQTSLSKADSAVQDISGKADKVASATNGNFAGLDSNGNLTDSGKKSSDFATAASVTAIEGKIPSGASSSNKMATASDVTTITNGVIANTKLIKDTVGWSGKNKATFIQGIIGGDPTSGYGLADNGSSIVAKVDNNTDYIACKKSGQGDRFKIVLFANYPTHTASHDATQIIADNIKTSYKFNSGNYNYAVLSYDSSTTIAQDTAEAMIYDADILDDTYEPYFGSTAFPRSEQAVLGAGNFLPNNLVTETVQDVTITVNDDKTFSTSGTNSGATIFRTVGTILNPKIGTNFILTGCPSGGGANTYDLYCVCRDSSNTAILIGGDAGIGYSFTVPANTVKIEVTLRIQASINMADKIFKPMIALSADTPYAPYAMTNRELTEAVAYQRQSITKNGLAIACAKFGKNLAVFSFVNGTNTEAYAAGDTIFTLDEFNNLFSDSDRITLSTESLDTYAGSIRIWCQAESANVVTRTPMNAGTVLRTTIVCIIN